MKSKLVCTTCSNRGCVGRCRFTTARPAAPPISDADIHRKADRPAANSTDPDRRVRVPR